MFHHILSPFLFTMLGFLWILGSPISIKGYIALSPYSCFRKIYQTILRICIYFVMVSELFLWRALLHALPSFFFFIFMISCAYVMFLFLSFSKMAGERTTRSATSELSTNSYLFLHHGENPAVSLVSSFLDSTNYHPMSRSIVTALYAKNKMEFVLSTHLCPPTSDLTYSAWARCNNMVVSWLVLSISLLIRQSVIWM